MRVLERVGLGERFTARTARKCSEASGGGSPSQALWPFALCSSCSPSRALWPFALGPSCSTNRCPLSTSQTCSATSVLCTSSSRSTWRSFAPSAIRPAVMYLGRPAEVGLSEVVLDAPAHPYTGTLRHRPRLPVSTPPSHEPNRSVRSASQRWRTSAKAQRRAVTSGVTSRSFHRCSKPATKPTRSLRGRGHERCALA